MPILRNSRWETFAQALAEGASQRKAYRKAFPNSEKWKDATVDNKAYALAKKGEVLERYNELKEEAAKALEVARAEKLGGEILCYVW